MYTFFSKYLARSADRDGFRAVRELLAASILSKMDWWLSSFSGKPSRHGNFSQADNNAGGIKISMARDHCTCPQKSTNQKNPKPMWMFAGQPSPRANTLEVWGWFSWCEAIDFTRKWLLQENSRWEITFGHSYFGTWTTHQKGIQILSQCVLLPTGGRRKCYNHPLAHMGWFFLLFSCESKLTSAACCNKSSPIFSFPHSFLFKGICTLDLNTLYSFL